MWNRDAHAKKVVDLQNAFFKKVGPAHIVDGYNLDGKVAPLSGGDTGRWNVPSFVSTAAVGAYVSGDKDYRESIFVYAVDLREHKDKDGKEDKGGYYHTGLDLLSMLLISGKMQNPDSNNTPYHSKDKSYIIYDEGNKVKGLAQHHPGSPTDK